MPGSEFKQDQDYSAAGPTFTLWSPQGFFVSDAQDNSVVLPAAGTEMSATSLNDVEPEETSAFPPEDDGAR